MKKMNYDDYRRRIDRVCEEQRQDYFVSALMNNGSITRMKYVRLSRMIDEFAKFKTSQGLRDGDRVLLLTPVIADAFITLAVLTACHLTVVLADAGVPKAELEELISSTEVSAIFTDVKRLPLVSSYKGVIPIYQVYGMKTDLKILCDAGGERTQYQVTPDTMAIIFSSSTTSKMKPIQISYDGFLASSDRNYEVLDFNKKQRKMPCLMVFPANHISGFSCSMGMLVHGLQVATVETVSSASLVASIRMFQPVEFGMVPKVLGVFIEKLEEELKLRHIFFYYKAMRAVSAFFRRKLGVRRIGWILLAPLRKAVFGKNMYTILSGGAPIIPDVASAMLDMGFNFIVNYSSTECGVPILETDKAVNDALGTVGHIDSDPNVKIRINNPDDSGVGEVYVSSRYAMIGYYGDTEKTREAFDGEWFRTGDSGYIDPKGYLYISGRSKDTIMLSSGKKVSPDDLENLLLSVVGMEMKFSVVGVPDEDMGCDDIHVFIEGEYSEAQMAELRDSIYSWQRAEAKLYPITDIHFIRELPKTSVGKVKRNILRDIVAEQKMTKPELSQDTILEGETPVDGEVDILTKVNEIVMRHAGITEPLTGYEHLIDDLGIDSLTMMEICTEIESLYGVFIGTYLVVLPNTREIADYVRDPFFISKSNAVKPKAGKFDAYEFPKTRKNIHRLAYRLAGDWFERHIEFEVSGLEHIQKDESYIYCPNHQTHVDGLWVWRALGELCPPVDSIGCMAKMEHLDSAGTRFMLTVLGGIPVDRSGNTMGSFRRSIDFIREGNSFLIHPEGTRTRDGKIGAYKPGAAAMAIESGVSLVPVAIDGGLDVWSYDMKRPVTRDKKTGKKKKVHITFGKPIPPDAGTAEELTEQLYRFTASVVK